MASTAPAPSYAAAEAGVQQQGQPLVNAGANDDGDDDDDDGGDGNGDGNGDDDDDDDDDDDGDDEDGDDDDGNGDGNDGGNDDISDDEGVALATLHDAARAGDLARVQALVAAGADLEEKGGGAWDAATALYYAA